jgi:hypothetical protein
MPLHALHSVTILLYRLFTVSVPHNCIANQQTLSLLYFCVFFSCRFIYLIIMATLHILWQFCTMCSSSMDIMLRFLSFSNYRNSLSSLSVTTSQLWLLWLQSPFLHVTSGGDHTIRIIERLSIQ